MQTELLQRKIKTGTVKNEKKKLKIPYKAVEFVLFYIAAVLRFLYYGFTYYPQLDDYIQYYKYANSGTLSEVIQGVGLLAARPLAGVADIALWSKFWGDGMIFAVLIVSAMWVASAFLFRKVFDKLFGCGVLFSVIYLLMPLGFEGTYWLSASTRIVCGMFFCALSLWFFVQFLDSGKKRYCALFLPTQLVSFCFYEQVLALSGGAVLVISLIALTKPEWRKRSAWGFLTFLNIAAYFAFTAVFASDAESGSTLTQRMKTVFPWDVGYFTWFMPRLFDQFKSAFLGGSFYTLTRGFIRGLKIIADGGWWYLILYSAVSVGIGVFSLTPHGRNKTEERRIGAKRLGFLYALMLILASISPLFIVENIWVSFRAAVPAFVGVALLADLSVRAVFGKHKRIAYRVSAVLAATCTLFFGIASVSELHDYKLTYENDQKVLTALAEKFDGAEGRIGILNLNPSYLEEQNCFYHEHIHGVTESYWALQGSIWGYTEKSPRVYPLPTTAYPFYVNWNRVLRMIGGFDSLWWWDNDTATLTPLTAIGSDEDGWTIKNPDGEVVGYVYEEYGRGYLVTEDIPLG